MDREPQKQYWEEELEKNKGKANRMTDDEAAGGFGALTWVASIVVSIGFLLRWLLK